MKFLRLLSVFLLSVSVVTCQQTQDEQPTTQLTLPIKLVDGYGPFPPGFSKLENEVQDGSDISKMALPLRGLPRHWASVQRDMVWLNTEQLVYQNFRAGTISPAWYEGTKAPQGWHLAQDETRLSKKPIKCYVYVIWGFDTKAGKWLAMVDTNNNLDFSDETAFEPEVIKPATLSKPDPAAPKVQYEVYQHGKIETRSIPMVVRRSGDDLFYNFPQYALATVERDGRTYELAVSYGLTKPDFEETYLVQPPTWFWQDNVKPEDLVELQQNITLGGVTYKNKGVDLYNNVLRLEPLSPDKKEYSLQVGYPFRPFAEKEFGSGKPISLANYKGKYVYIDFWGTWCKGCVEDMPALKQIYQKLDKDRFAFVGIVAKDSPERLAAFVEKQQIGWPQIFSDDQNKLVDGYSITGYPTSVLLDPNGTVIAKNLRPEALRAKIAELSR